MAQSFATYSKMIAWLKIILPLAAVILLATLFLLARGIDPERSIPFAQVDVKQLAREPRITAPEFTGMTADGAAIMISASSARTDLPVSEDLFANRLTAQFQTPDGAEILAQADSGAIENARVAYLEGDVFISSSTGYLVKTDRITADLDKTEIETDGAVTADGPLGQIEAGKMIVQLHQATGESILVFKDGIRVLYDPNAKK